MTPPFRTLNKRPNLNQLKRQARELQKAFLVGEPSAVAEVNAYIRGADPASFALNEAQTALARAYGFASWPKLKAHVDGVTLARLVEAIKTGDLVLARRLLKTRPELANMETAYGNEHRPLHYAVMERSPEMTRLLMEYGANARAGIYPHRDATGALTLARERGYDELVAIIEEQEQQPRKSKKTETQAPAPEPAQQDSSLRAVVAAGDLDALRKRHAEGGIDNPIDWSSGGLLTVAVEHDQAGALSLLLDFGLDPDERVRSGDAEGVITSAGYPLWQCAAAGKYELAETLLKRGANPNVHVDSSGSSVYSAYSHRQWKMVELLKRYDGLATPDIAGLYRETERAKQLLEDDAAGLLPEGMTSPGKTVAEDLVRFGADGGDPEIVRMGLERIDWPREDSRWHWVLASPLSFWNHIPWLYAGNQEFDRTTYLPCFRLILERCGANTVGLFGQTILHETASAGDYITDEELAGFATALLDAGAKMDVRDDLLKSTPLGWACRWGRAALVKLMLERGADPVEADAEPWATPLAWAEKRSHQAVLDVLRSSR
jgi:ankyrin repeat protein